LIFYYFEDYSGFNRAKYSHKYDGPGIRWLLTLSTATGLILNLSGPYLPGIFPDLSIYRSRIKPFLLDGEFVLNDLGFRGDETCINAHDSGPPSIALKRRKNLLARHETINGRVKIWACANTSRVRHLDVHYYTAMITAVHVIVQIEMMIGFWKPFENEFTGPLRR